jgi:hypothetical protein
MAPFSTIEAAAAFVREAPLTGDVFELPMVDGYTLNGKADIPMGKYSLGTIQIAALLVGRDFRPDGHEKRDGIQVFRFARIQMSTAKEIPFPSGFKTQRLGLSNAAEIYSMPGPDVVKFFEEHADTANALVGESADKRYVPSTFIMNVPGGWRVGWFASGDGMQCVQTFSKRSDAVADYVLFSLGVGRWNGQELFMRDAQ